MRLMFLSEATSTLGKAGLEKSWQAKFPPITKCCRCGEKARIAFVTHEMDTDEKELIRDLHKNTLGVGGDFWPHDAVAVAIYFCIKCTEPTALYNQA